MALPFVPEAAQAGLRRARLRQSSGTQGTGNLRSQLMQFMSWRRRRRYCGRGSVDQRGPKVHRSATHCSSADANREDDRRRDDLRRPQARRLAGLGRLPSPIALMLGGALRVGVPQRICAESYSLWKSWYPFRKRTVPGPGPKMALDATTRLLRNFLDASLCQVDTVRERLVEFSLWITLRIAARAVGDLIRENTPTKTQVVEASEDAARRLGITLSSKLVLFVMDAAAIIVSVVFAVIVSAQWDIYLRFRYGGSFGVVDRCLRLILGSISSVFPSMSYYRGTSSSSPWPPSP